MDNAFRKIDVDLYEEDQVFADDLYDPFHLDPSSASQNAKDVERQSRALISKGDAKSALQLALKEAPHGDASYVAAKTTSLQSIIFILLQVQQSEIPNIVKQLSLEDRDALMKYVYKGMENPAEGPSGNSQCAALLQWHAQILAVTGVGSIIRTMTDRRQI